MDLYGPAGGELDGVLAAERMSCKDWLFAGGTGTCTLTEFSRDIPCAPPRENLFVPVDRGVLSGNVPTAGLFIIGGRAWTWMIRAACACAGSADGICMS
jgi:hypothetical protein